MAYARPSLVEFSKRQEERKNNMYHATGTNGTADMDHGNLGEGSNDDESQNGGKDGSHPRRWSPDEDERLRNAVEKHHEANWKEIATEVGSRNHVQCLQRWKKVLTPGLVKGQWSREEDELLMSLVSEGHKNWGTLAARIPGRTSKQCRERWCHHLDPRIVKGDWTSEEDQILLSMHEEMGNKWATIAQHLNGRTENATKIRWKILERSLKQEDAGQNIDQVPRGNAGRQVTDGRLRCLATQAAVSVMSKAKDSVNPIGIPQNPAAVLDALGGESPEDLAARDPPQKRRSWEIEGKVEDRVSPADAKDEELGEGGFKKRKLKAGKSPSCLSTSENARGKSGVEALDTSFEPKESSGTGGRSGRRGWLREEDERLRLGVGKLGDRNWRYVAQIVGTRTHVQCQQRWKKALRPGLIKGAWSVEEDENLMRLIGQGFSTWSELASHTPGRTAKQCRERWCHHLDPSVNHGSWAEEEDRQLLALQDRLGTKWSAIAREMPGRTEHAVKGRVKTLSRTRRVGTAGVVCANKGKTPPERSELLKQERGPVRTGEVAKVSSLTSRSPVQSAANVGLRRPRAFNSAPPSPVPRDDEPCEFEVQDKFNGVQQDGTNVKQHGFQHPCVVNLQSGNGEYDTQGTRDCLSQYSSRSRDPQDDTLVGFLHVPSSVGVEGSSGGTMAGGDSIAKLLSISSLGTDSVSALPEDIANPGSGDGSCGGGKLVIPNKDHAPREMMGTQISLHQSAPVGRARMEVLPSRARQDIVPSDILDQSLGGQLASGSLSRRGPRQETMSQMPEPGTEDLNVLIPCIPEGPNADVSGPSGFDGSVSSNIVTSVPSGVDVPAPSASGVSNPALNILEPLKVGLAGVRNVGIATDPNTGIQGTCNVDSCDPQGNSASGESSLSVSRPSEVDFSDLASFLTESVNTQQDVVGGKSEGVSLGDDPYSNYYDNGYLIPGITKPSRSQLPEVIAPTGALGHSVENSFQDIRDGWEGSPEDWAIKVLDAVCDPYF